MKIVSIVLGLILGFLFVYVSKGPKCVIVTGPPPDEIKDKYFKIDGDCYTYTQKAIECDKVV